MCCHCEPKGRSNLTRSVIARAKPVAISRDPSLRSGQGLLQCVRKDNSMDASESAWGFDFGVMSLRYKSEGYQLPAGNSDSSGASVANCCFPTFNNHRHLPDTTANLQHLVQFFLIRFHIIIGCFFSIG